MTKVHFFGFLALVGIVVLIASGASLFETNNAGYLQVKQAAVSGELSCRLNAGMYWQGFGAIHTYKEAETFYFTAAPGKEDAEPGTSERPGNQSLPTRFNDGTKAEVSGSLRVLLPTDCESLVKIHRKFHSMDNLMVKLVYPAVNKSLFNTGPHMTAAESYAERRGEFAMLAEDQLKNGTIMTDKEPVETVDPITGEKKTIMVLKQQRCKDEAAPGGRCIGGFVRDPSAFHEFGVSITNFVIDGIEYPKAVLDQIEVQRSARMNILTVQAQAKEADARAQKADAEAKAQIAETRAKEEVAKTEKVVRAEAAKAEAVLQASQVKEVAALDVQSAELERKAAILRAEGQAEAARKRIVADGALAQKLETYEAVNAKWAEAYAQQRPTPDMVLGGGEGGGGNPALSLMTLLGAKAARDLQLDLGISRVTGGGVSMSEPAKVTATAKK